MNSLFTIKGVMEYLVISRSYLYSLIKAGRIKYVDLTLPTAKRKRVLRFRPEDIQELINTV